VRALKGRCRCWCWFWCDCWGCSSCEEIALHGERPAIPLHNPHSVLTVLCLTLTNVRHVMTAQIQCVDHTGFQYNTFKASAPSSALSYLDLGSPVHCRAYGFQVLGTGSGCLGGSDIRACAFYRNPLKKYPSLTHGRGSQLMQDMGTTILHFGEVPQGPRSYTDNSEVSQ
jgi:hypothetical protein